MIGMMVQMAFALGLGFSQSESLSLPFLLLLTYASQFPDGITMDILRGCQGMGAAAALPAAVRCIALLQARFSH